MNNRIGDNLFHFGANEELVRELMSVGVKFVIIGGLAVAWYCPERQADDLDLLIEPSLENSTRISSALAKLHLSGFSADSFTRLGLQVPLKGSYYAELITPTQGLPTYSEVEADALPAKLFGMPVLVASIPALIAMKKIAVSTLAEQSEKHLNDIALLQKCAAKTLLQ
ncbi:hypothetical protein SAMN05216504_0811 [Pseudomonas sp. A214]|nr:hypothetical protein SAMN05216504_0811 [Pseudomonas sp. A214]